MTSLGCKLNQNEIESFSRDFAAAGHKIVSDPADAEVIILNSCTVTQIAARKSRQLARRLHRANETAKIILTGCFAEMEPDQALALPGVAQVVGNAKKRVSLSFWASSSQLSLPEIGLQDMDMRFPG